MTKYLIRFDTHTDIYHLSFQTINRFKLTPFIIAVWVPRIQGNIKIYWKCPSAHVRFKHVFYFNLFRHLWIIGWVLYHFLSPISWYTGTSIICTLVSLQGHPFWLHIPFFQKSYWSPKYCHIELTLHVTVQDSHAELSIELENPNRLWSQPSDTVPFPLP